MLTSPVRSGGSVSFYAAPQSPQTPFKAETENALTTFLAGFAFASTIASQQWSAIAVSNGVWHLKK